LLRACRNRPSYRCATKKPDELAALHSITSSARISSAGDNWLLSASQSFD
jgi:hypothetical protein